MYTIELGDGTKIKNLELSGNNFVTKQTITEDLFTEKKLQNVKITTNDAEHDMSDMLGEHAYMELVAIQKYGDEYYFVIRDIDESRLEIMRLAADVAYTAMMANVDLE